RGRRPRRLGMKTLLSSDTALVRRSRYGDRAASVRLASRYLDRVVLLASVVGSTTAESAELAKEGFATAVRIHRPFDDALVEAFGALALSDASRGRLLVLLVDVEQRPPIEAAA